MGATSNKLIVITGACGFLGRHVLQCLSAQYSNIIALDRGEPSFGLPSGIHYYKSSLVTPFDLIPRGVDSKDGFILVHLAWNMDRGSYYAAQAEQVYKLAGLLDYWKDRGLQKVIGVGSAEEYGSIEGIIREDDAPQGPLSPYGWAKRSAWQLASSWSGREKIPLIWLRPFIIYGPGQTGSMLLPSAIRSATRKENVDFSDGLQIRDFVYVSDVAEAVRLSVYCESSDAVAINLATEEPVRIRDLLIAVAKRLNAEECFKFGARQRKPGEPNTQIGDIARAKDLLNWAPVINLETGLETLFQYIEADRE